MCAYALQVFSTHRVLKKRPGPLSLETQTVVNDLMVVRNSVRAFWRSNQYSLLMSYILFVGNCNVTVKK